MRSPEGIDLSEVDMEVHSGVPLQEDRNETGHFSWSTVGLVHLDQPTICDNIPVFECRRHFDRLVILFEPAHRISTVVSLVQHRTVAGILQAANTD
jgi:hypothetical protein